MKGRVGRVADIINALNLCVSQGSSVVGGRGKGEEGLSSSHSLTPHINPQDNVLIDGRDK